MKFNEIGTVLSNFFCNLRYLFKYNNENVIYHSNATIDSILRELEFYKKGFFICLKHFIGFYYNEHKDLQKTIANELIYIQEQDTIDAFPYPQIKKLSHEIIACYDKKKELPFVLHNGKKLYFAKEFSIEQAKASYINYIERENLLGGGYTAKAPHQYQTDDFKIEQGDILLDIGCAEALLTLDSIDKLKKVYLFEGDKRWAAPLKATFEPYKEKVVFIPKFVSNTESDESTTLENFFSEIKNESFFIKMDIEGEEEKVLLASKKFLESQNNIKIACCTYHKAHHAESISKYLNSLNYKTTFSDGYMLFFYDPNFSPPYFRKGLIRANNAKSK